MALDLFFKISKNALYFLPAQEGKNKSSLVSALLCTELFEQ